jgi:hypothetical protein
VAEPPEVAATADPVAPGVWHWRVRNSNIGGATSSSNLIAAGEDVVLADPLRIAPDALAQLPVPTAIVLTAKCHQRSAWRYRREFGIPVWAPEGAPPADEQPDTRYAEGDMLPADLRAVRTPGPEPVHYCLVQESAPHVLVCSDLLMAGEDGALELVPGRFHDDPAETRRSVERLLDLAFDVLCLDHGPAITEDPKGAIRRLLAAAA